MISPSPTTPIAPGLARGVLAEVLPATATHGPMIVLEIPNTSYRLHLVPATAAGVPVGKRLIGELRGEARRVDAVETGGAYIEPLVGRPRRLQGRIVSVDPASNTVTVGAVVPFVCTLTDARQKPEQFTPGQLVALDLVDGATITPRS